MGAIAPLRAGADPGILFWGGGSIFLLSPLSKVKGDSPNFRVAIARVDWRK